MPGHRPWRRPHTIFLFGLCVLLLTACTTPSVLQQARIQFEGGAPRQALQTLEGARVANRDRLLLLLDRGAIAFSAGEYALAEATLLEAADLLEQWDLLRISEQATTLVTNERASRYRGEYSERLWIHTYLMMSFLLSGDAEAAAVEARRALQVMQAHESVLRLDWFTRALMALSFEAAGAYDSAQVEYRKLLADPDYLGEWDRVAARSGQRSEQGELVLFVQSGVIDPKLPGDLIVDINLRIAFPFYARASGPVPSYTVEFGTGEAELDAIHTDTVQLSALSLGERGGRIAGKQVARLAAKYALADAAAAENPSFGQLVRLAAFLTEQADTRSWETLPSAFSLLRVPLDAGVHRVRLSSNLGGFSGETGLGDVVIRPGEMTFLSVRH